MNLTILQVYIIKHRVYTLHAFLSQFHGLSSPSVNHAWQLIWTSEMPYKISDNKVWTAFNSIFRITIYNHTFFECRSSALSVYNGILLSNSLSELSLLISFSVKVLKQLNICSESPDSLNCNPMIISIKFIYFWLLYWNNTGLLLFDPSLLFVIFQSFRLYLELSCFFQFFVLFCFLAGLLLLPWASFLLSDQCIPH